MLPNSVWNHFVVEALHDCALDPVTVRPFSLKQAPILDAPRPLIEQLRLLIIVLDGLGQRGKRALLVYRQSQYSVCMVLLLFQLHICCLNTLEGVLIKVVFLIDIAHHFIPEGPLRQIYPVFIGGKVDIVAPFRPPGGADEELAIGEATKVCLKYERVLELSHGELLLALKSVLDRLLEVL